MATATVTVLFTDLVGSTALLSQVGDDAGEALRREHFALLRDGIGEGREVKNLGDGLMVVFASAVDAVAAGVAMQRAFERRNRHAERPLAIRIGIALGDADVDEDDYFGVPVVQAARLCGAAEGGEILCTDLVRLLAGSRTEASFTPLGDLELKGLDEPVPVSRVGWEALGAEGTRPLPGRLASSVAPTFVGRDAEHGRLTSAWKAAVVGAERQVVLLAGEPGIGKTSLAARLAGEVHAEGGLVVYGRSDEDLAIPYQPWIEALSQVVAAAPAATLAAHLSDRGPHLARLVPDLAARPSPEGSSLADDPGERFVLFGCVTDLIERVSGDVPVLLVLDDLHWADRQSLQLLRHLVTAGRPLRLLIVGTFRDSEVAAGDVLSELLAAFHREQGTDRIPMRGLTDVDLLRLLEQTAGHDMDDAGVALRDAVLAETGGNPFFVGEILRHLAESGAVYQGADGRWVGDLDVGAIGLPVSVKEVVGRRIAALGPDTHRLLSSAAVMGRDFDITLLAAVAGTDEDTVIDACDAAVAASILAPTDVPEHYTFAHALIEHTLYDALSPTRRSRTHRAVAEAIEQRYGGDLAARAGELAHHWAAAVQPSDTERVLHYARLAGERALEQLAPDEALRWFTQAGELLDRNSDADDRLRSEVLIGLGTAQNQCGVSDHRQTLLDAAHIADRIDAVDLLRRAALANSRGWASNTGHTDHERIAVLRRAADCIDPDHPDRALLLVYLALEHTYDGDVELAQRRTLAEEAVAVARRNSDVATLATVLCLSAVSISTSATLEQRVAWTEEACRLVDGLNDPMVLFTTSHERALTAAESGDLPRLRERLVIADQAITRCREASRIWVQAFSQVWVLVAWGTLQEAEAAAEEALAIGIEGDQPDALMIYAAQLTNIRFQGGRVHELIDLMAETDQAAPVIATFRAVIAAARAHNGEHEAVHALLDEALAAGFPGREDITWASTQAAWVDAAVEVGHRPAAAVLRDRLAPSHHHHLIVTGASIQPAVPYYLGRLDHVLGRLDDADRWFEQADRIHRAVESPLLIAYSDASWAALLADRSEGDDHDRARRLADRALTVAVPGGYGYVEARARAALARLSDS